MKKNEHQVTIVATSSIYSAEFTTTEGKALKALAQLRKTYEAAIDKVCGKHVYKSYNYRQRKYTTRVEKESDPPPGSELKITITVTKNPH
jgi:hypothetical protein